MSAKNTEAFAVAKRDTMRTTKRRNASKQTAAGVSNTTPRTARTDSSADGKPRQSSKRRRKSPAAASASRSTARKRGRKSYPVVALGDVISLAEGIMKHNAGKPVKRETLLKTMGLEINAQSTRNLVTNSNKYGLTDGNCRAEFLKLTPNGEAAVDTKAKRIDQMKARFALAIGDVPEFKSLYEKRKGSNMPAPEMLHDDLQDVDAGDRKPCADVFISNAKYLGLLVEREGAQYLMAEEEWFASTTGVTAAAVATGAAMPIGNGKATADAGATDYENVCFVLSTIKEAGSDERKHADMVLNQYIERALEGTGLKLVRADKIGDPGMISKQIIEYLVYSQLVVADLSFHNPNVYYELSLRHVTGKPTVHLIQESDKIPFDLLNFRTIKIDTTDKYKMVSELDTLRSEISTAVRQTLANGESRDNPILTFCPNARFVMDDQP